MKNQILGAICALAASGCTLVGAIPKGGMSGIDRSNFDARVRPQDDLYRAVNGKWLEKTEIPADKSNYGSFTKLEDDAQVQLKEIIRQTAAKRQPQGSEEQKVGDYYSAFMDESQLETLGLQPLAAELARIDALKSKREIPLLMAHFSRIGVNTPLFPYVHQDNKDSTRYIGDFYQTGLGLPDRDFYLLDDAKFKDIRTAYLAHIQKMLALAGIANAAAAAKDILALETRLAKSHWDKVDNRDPVKTYNKFAPGKLGSLAGEIDWPAYLDAVGFASLPAVIVTQPSYVTGFGKTLDGTELATWKSYFKWQLLNAYAPILSKPFVDENFSFFGKTLNGIQENRPRWKRGVEAVENAMGEAVGKIYVARHFPPENKARMEKLVQNLLKAYEQEFPTLDWMSPETQRAARAKLAKFTYKIGYPDKWRDYSTLAIKADDLVGNSMRAAQFEYQRNIKKLGGPIDRGEWGMTPQTVNAYYNPEMNEIVFPAAILQPPFFNVAADDAVNYGAIGAVIGHEISHGFDDQGSQYDGDGNLRSWWTKKDRKKFDALGARLAAQYDQYEPVKGYKLNGKFTLGENIADLGGMTIAYEAYQLSLAGKPAPVIEGMTGDERFFMGWAQVWRRKYREENLINRTKTDPHSPSEFRANGVVVNMPAFYESFGVKQGDKLFKPEGERIRIW
jgi:predicted metalloendopeptidase